MKYGIAFLGLILMVVLLAAPQCPIGPVVTITNPAQNAKLHEFPDVVIELSPGTEPTSLVVILNNRDVSDKFVIDGNTAVGSADVLEYYFSQGQNKIAAVAHAAIPVPVPGADVSFFLDTKAPDVVLSAMTGDTNITLSGTIKDLSGIVNFSVNGVNAGINGNSFTVSVPADPYLEFVTEDTVGNVLSETFVKPATQLPNAMGFQFLQKGFDILADAVENEITQYDIQGALIAQNPLGVGDVIINDKSLHFEVVLTSMTYDIPQVYFSATANPPNSLILSTEWNNIVMHLDAYLTYQGEPTTTSPVTLYCNSLKVTDVVSLEVVDHVLVATAHNVTSEIGTVTIDGASLPDEVEQQVMANGEALITSELTSLIETEAPPFIDSFLAQIAFNETKSSPFPITFSGVPDSFLTNEQSGTFFMAGQVSSDEVSTRPQLVAGAFYTPSEVPVFDYTTSEQGLPYDFAVTMSDDTINQYVYTLYRNDIFYISQEADLKEIFKDIIPPEILNAIPASLMRFSIWTDEVPQIKFNFKGSPVGGKFDKIVMRVEYLDENLNQWKPMVDARLNGIFPAEIISADGKSISLLFSASSMIEVELLQIGLKSLPAEVVQDIINLLLPFFLDLASDQMQAIPLPTIQGFQLTLVEVVPHGMTKDYLTLFSTLQ